MTAFKSVSRHIRDALITLLQGVEYDTGSGAESAFGLVTDDPSAEFDQEPYCLVYPGKLDTKKAAVGLQDRDVNFAIFIELSLVNGKNADGSTRTQQQTYGYMYDLAELTLNALDEADWTGQLHTIDNTIENWILEATRSTMYPAKSKEDTVLLCRIDVCIKYSFDL